MRRIRSTSISRFIPTCVGLTAPFRGAIAEVSVHPHMRGAYSRPSAPGTASVRFIPTCVGLTAVSDLSDLSGSGSSPHAWGLLGDDDVQHSHISVHPHMRGAYDHQGRTVAIKQRFIPTCVGLTVYSQSSSPFFSVHPHMRGAYVVADAVFAPGIGSSPHAWGLRMAATVRGRRLPVHPHMRGAYGHLGAGAVEDRRFIPTCVGLTSSSLNFIYCPPVHPHMRGAYHKQVGQKKKVIGSSPHAWGLPFRPSSLILDQRFIPTCVGLTVMKAFSVFWAWVHPHMRGAY